MADESAENPFYVPEHLIFNILLRLPVKSILVCTSVCKTWNSFIKSPSFVSSHLNRTISENETRLYLLQLGSRNWPGKTTYTFSLRSDDDKELSEYLPLHFPYEHDDGFQVIVSYNGLVLLMNGTRRLCNLILWNPVIRKSVIILKDENIEYLEAAGLGRDSKTGDYKVLTVIGEINILRVELYSLKTNSWKRLSDVEATPQMFFKFNREMIFVNGALHFIAFRQRRFMILGFDLDAETFREIELPECMSHYFYSNSLSLWVCGESISVLWQKKVDRLLERQIWVMEKYGVRESWTHLVTLDQVLDSPLKCNGLVYKSDGNILMSTFLGRVFASWMVSHDLKSQVTVFGYFDGKPACYFLGNYLESLLLLDKGDDLSMVFGTDSCNSNDASFGSSSGNAEGISNTASCSQAVILPVDSSDEEWFEVGEDFDETLSNDSTGAASETGSETDSTDDLAANDASSEA